MAELPLYLVIEDMFAGTPPFQKIIKTGSVVRTLASPGPHLKPLNAEAEIAMEAWYNMVYTYYETSFDGEGNPIQMPRKIQPHMKYKMAAQGPIEPQHEVEVLQLPQQSQPGGLSLAETLAGSMKTSTDMRPGPDPVLSPDLSRILGDTEIVEAPKERVITR